MAKTNANLIWKIADLLRGPYQPNMYGNVILPFTILRRLDCILEPSKDEVLAEYKKIQSTKVDPDVLLKAKFKLPFYNTSRWTFASLVGDPEGVADNLVDYTEHFSPNVRDVFDGFGLIDEITKLAKSDRLYLIVKEFAAVDLHPNVVSGHDMGYIFEELIRKFAESNSTQAGDHFTLREVIALMVDILFLTEDDALTKQGIVRTIYDPAAVSQWALWEQLRMEWAQAHGVDEGDLGGTDSAPFDIDAI
jgi:type I restriction enzyme M protein